MRAHTAVRTAAASEPVIEPHWRPLARVASVAALLIALIIPLSVAVFLVWPPPLGEDAAAWFRLFNENALRGLLGLDLLFLGVWALQLPIVLTLYVALRGRAPSVMLLATALALVATAVYVPSNPGFELWSLSRAYAATDDPARQAVLLAAGEANLARFQGTAFRVSYVLAAVAGVLLAGVLWRSRVFGRAVAVARLLASVLGLGLFLPAIGAGIALGSVLFEWVWYVLIGWRLWQRGRPTPPD